ncbi:MAG: protein translocase subunit SecF [Deltaproteobacteria bacterium]|nr:protein translocase subunit SecF [Deltaproteobacteria bacterium]
MTENEKYVFPFMRLKWVFIAISVAFIVASIGLVIGKGLNFGVDFKGGIKLVYQFTRPIGDGEIRGMLGLKGFPDADVIRFGGEAENRYLVKTKFIADRNVSQEILAALQALDPGASLISEENVGPKVGAELRRRGIFAIILAWILILVYIGIRFDFLFAPGGIVALIHDVTIPIGFFALFGKEVNLPILAASLTIIGFSINDTVVIFDRIRENLRKMPASVPLARLIDISLTETLSRTIVTSLTVLFVVVILFLFGGGVIHDFAFFMIVGVFFGSYSTLFIASPIYLGLQKMFPHHGMGRQKHK